MNGYILKYRGRVYHVAMPDQDTMITSCIVRDEFNLDARPAITSARKLRPGIEFEVEFAEFDELPDPVCGEYQATDVDVGFPEVKESIRSVWKQYRVVDIDPEYRKMEYRKMEDRRDAESYWKSQLDRFRKIEAVLKKEGLI